MLNDELLRQLRLIEEAQRLYRPISDIDRARESMQQVYAASDVMRAMETLGDTQQALVDVASKQAELGKLVRELGQDAAVWQGMRQNAIREFSTFLGATQSQFEWIRKSLEPVTEIARMIQLHQDEAVGFLRQLGLQPAGFEGDSGENEEDSPIITPEKLRQSIIETNGLSLQLLIALERNPELAIADVSGGDGRTFELLTAYIVEKLGGEDVQITPRSSDNGIDVICRFRVDHCRVVFGFQAKAFTAPRPVKGKHARELRGALALPPLNAKVGVLCTTSRFQPQAEGMFITCLDLDGWTPKDMAALYRGDTERLDRLIKENTE